MKTLFNISVQPLPRVTDQDPDPIRTNCVKKFETDDYR